MIVLVLVGLAASAIVLTLPSPAATLRDDAERFALRLSAARDAAVIGGRAMQISISASGYGFARREGSSWRPLDEKPFVTTDWRRGASALVGALGRQRILFDPAGVPSEAATVTLVRNDAHASVRLTLDGRVTVQ
jgi:general secretion pathway protein H